MLNSQCEDEGNVIHFYTKLKRCR